MIRGTGTQVLRDFKRSARHGLWKSLGELTVVPGRFVHECCTPGRVPVPAPRVYSQMACPYPRYWSTGVQNLQKFRVRVYVCCTELTQVSARVAPEKILRACSLQNTTLHLNNFRVPGTGVIQNSKEVLPGTVWKPYRTEQKLTDVPAQTLYPYPYPYPHPFIFLQGIPVQRVLCPRSFSVEQKSGIQGTLRYTKYVITRPAITHTTRLKTRNKKRKEEERKTNT